MLARGSRRRCPAFTSREPVTTLNPPSRHSCQTGERRTVPSSRYVASTATIGSSRRSPRSSGVSGFRMPLGGGEGVFPPLAPGELGMHELFERHVEEVVVERPARGDVPDQENAPVV